MNTTSSAPVRYTTVAVSIDRISGSGPFEIGGRVLLGVLFFVSGTGNIAAYSASADYMSSFGVPGLLLPVVVATEVLGALAFILGRKTCVAAFLLAGFSLLTAVIFHPQIDPSNSEAWS